MPVDGLTAALKVPSATVLTVAAFVCFVLLQSVARIEICWSAFCVPSRPLSVSGLP